MALSKSFVTTEVQGSQFTVQGSKFRVNGKEGIEDPKSSLNMAIFQSNCKFGSKF
jgi:hypothetical protein